MFDSYDIGMHKNIQGKLQLGVGKIPQKYRNRKKKDIEYLGVCGNNLKSLGIKSIYDQKDITYMAFTDVIFNSKRYQLIPN